MKSLDVIDLINDVIVYYGGIINASSDARSLQLAIQEQLLGLLSRSRQAIRKKSILALASLGKYLALHCNHVAVIESDDVFLSLVNVLLKETQNKQSPSEFENVSTILSCLSSICKSCGHRMSSIMPSLITTTLAFTNMDDDGLKESCFQSMEIFVQNSNIEHAVLLSIFGTAVQYMSYDPNYIDDQDVDMEDQDQSEYFIILYLKLNRLL